MAESAWVKIRQFLLHLDVDIRKIIRWLECLHTKILKCELFWVFNEHAYIYIYIYIHILSSRADTTNCLDSLSFSLSLSLSLSHTHTHTLILPLYRPSFLETPPDGSQYLHKSDLCKLFWLTNSVMSMCGVQLGNIICEFVPASSATRRMSCSSYVEFLWVGRPVAL